MTSKFIIPKTYSGLLDDVVDRYRITPEVDSSFFNRSILRNLFFSGPVFLNDGYLLNHPSSLEQLLDENSLLRSMISKQFVELLVRQPNAEAFANNPELMASKGIKSFQNLVSKSDWPEFKRKLTRWADGYYASDKFVKWPNYKMHEGFQKLFSRVFITDLEDLGLKDNSEFKLDEFRRAYEEHSTYSDGPRTAVEEVLLSMQEEGKIDLQYVTDVMNIANQCYHYNFAMCLSKSTNSPVVADTTIGKAFDDILELDDVVEAEIADMPVLTIPKGFPVNKGAGYEVFLDVGSNVAYAKRQFLLELEKVFKTSGKESASQQAKIVNEASQEYRKRLAEYFQGRVGVSDWAPRTTALVTFGLGKLGSVFGADYAILAANLAAGKGQASFVHKMTKSMSKKILEIAFDPERGSNDAFEFNVGEINPRFASLAFNPDAVDNHTADIPPMFPE